MKKHNLPLLKLAPPSKSRLSLSRIPIINHKDKIESWFKKQWTMTQAPILSSVDIRRSAFKLAPVDTNLFPAGFNNIHPRQIKRCVEALQARLPIENNRNILIVAENHTRNQAYLNHLSCLEAILTKAHHHVKIGIIDPQLTSPITHTLTPDKVLTIHPILIDNDQLRLQDFHPNTVLLNNDLSSGAPSLLKNASNHITPPVNLGWFKRRKSTHFTHYNRLATALANTCDFDPWLISTYFDTCNQVNFMGKTGLTELQKKSQKLLDQIKQKYMEHGIEHEPFLIAKSDRGTYGMAVMTITSADDVLSLNRKQRTRMSKTKGNQIVTDIIIQEGVPSTEHYQNHTAETVAYNIGQHVVDGFFRYHQKKGPQDNLNSPGVEFTSFETTVSQHPSPFYPYSVTARLAALAAAHEIIHTQEEIPCPA